jgi:hypothetical protein
MFFFDRELKILRNSCKLLLNNGVHLLMHDQLVNKDEILFYLSNTEYDLAMETVNKQVEIYTDPLRLCDQSNAIIFCNISDLKVKTFF